MSKLAQYLNEHVVGNVFDNPKILDQFRFDQSILEMRPRLVAYPESADDIRRLTFFADQLASKGFSLPVTVRGTGLDKTGAAVGPGLLISTDHLDQIEELDLRGRLVRVQAGVTLDRLNSAMRLMGLELPIKTDPGATIGGLIANCPSDDMMDRYGGIFHFVERVEMVLSSGELVQLSPLSLRNLAAAQQKPGLEGAIYRNIDQLFDKHADIIMDRDMQPFDLSGYANITKVRQGHHFDLLPLIFASQGTLGIITDVILRLEPVPSATQRLAVSFHDIRQAQRFLTFARDLEPRTLQVYDLKIIERASEFGNKPNLFRRKIGNGLLAVVEFDGWRFRMQRKIRECLDFLPSDVYSVVETPENQDSFREIEHALLSFLNDDVRGERAAVLDDVYVPDLKFDEFWRQLKAMEKDLDTELTLYGSYATANYQVRPEFDCSTPEGRTKLQDFLEAYTKLVVASEGSITGGTPEGRTKAILREPFPVGEQALYHEIKEIFDPNHILNPNVKIDVNRKKVLNSFRTQPLPGITC